MNALVERIKLVADVFALISIDFLDANDNIVQNDPVYILLGFSNGEEVKLTREEFDSFHDYPFIVDKGFLQ